MMKNVPTPKMEEKFRENKIKYERITFFIFLILVKFLAKNKRWRSSRWVHSGPWGGGGLQFHVVLGSHLWRNESGPRPEK